MGLVTLDDAKTFLKLALTNTAEDDFIELLIDGVSAGVERYIGYPIEAADYEEYYDGRGYPDLVLRKRPVIEVTEVRLDQSGNYGLPAGSFADETIQELGVDYAPLPGNSGLLRRLRSRSELPWFGMYTSRTLTPLASNAVWPSGNGNVYVEYTAGYEIIPADVQNAVLQLIAWQRATGPAGGTALTSESLGDYSYTRDQIAQTVNDALVKRPELMSPRGLLARYRELAL